METAKWVLRVKANLNRARTFVGSPWFVSTVADVLVQTLNHDIDELNRLWSPINVKVTSVAGVTSPILLNKRTALDFFDSTF